MTPATYCQRCRDELPRGSLFALCQFCKQRYRPSSHWRGRGSGELFPETSREIWAQLRAAWPAMPTAQRRVWVRWLCTPYVRYEFEKQLGIRLPRTPGEHDAWILGIAKKVHC